MVTLRLGSPLPIFIPYLLKAEVLTKGTEYDICNIAQTFTFEKVKKKIKIKTSKAKGGLTWEVCYC